MSEGNSKPTIKERRYGFSEHTMAGLTLDFAYTSKNKRVCRAKTCTVPANFDSQFNFFSEGYDMRTGKPNIIQQGKKYKLSFSSNNKVEKRDD